MSNAYQMHTAYQRHSIALLASNYLAATAETYTPTQEHRSQTQTQCDQSPTHSSSYTQTHIIHIYVLYTTQVAPFKKFS